MKADRYVPVMGFLGQILLREAAETNEQRDAIDKANGMTSPSEAPVDVCLRTIIDAMAAGLSAGNESCIAEALDMAISLEFRVRARRPSGRQKASASQRQ